MSWQAFLSAAQLAQQAGKGLDQFFNEFNSQNPRTTDNSDNLTSQRQLNPYGDPNTGYIPAVGSQMNNESARNEGEYYRVQGFNKGQADDIRQQNHINTMAANDQQYRANAANNMLNSYQQARAANQNFLASLGNNVAAMAR